MTRRPQPPATVVRIGTNGGGSMRFLVSWLVAGGVLVSGSGLAAQGANATTRPPVSTGVTGSIEASGLDDPQYVLSFVPVQRLMLEAARHALTRKEVDDGVAGTPVSRADLLRLELLRQDEEGYRLNYLLLTIADQRAIYRVAERFSLGLADAFRSHKADFDEIFRRYPRADLRPQTMFDLVAGAALNWGGLELTTALGYRVQPPRHANGGVYLVHSEERGAALDFTGLYLDSETWPGSKISFSTFGDGVSLPRLRGLPDVFEGVEGALQDWKEAPDVYAALRTEYLAYIGQAMEDAGLVMSAVADGADTDAALTRALSMPEDRRRATVQLLTTIGYLRRADDRYATGVPVLTAEDKPLVEATLRLSRAIVTDWLRRNYPAMEDELSGLSPARNGLPFSLAFSEVWHYVFGFATKSLAESGFYANPRAQGSLHDGYVPLVWASSLLRGPGS